MSASVRSADHVPKGATAFIHELAFEDLPPPVVKQAQRCVLDLIGVAAGGRSTAASEIACRFAVQQLNGREKAARILFDGRTASPAGAAYAGATMIDSLDGHDGHPLTKGHAGVALLPSLLAVLDAEKPKDMEGRAFLTALAVGYEIAIRAGMALHASVSDYHTSGAWNGLGSAAIGARLLGLNHIQTREAFGIAEYHGPRSQMMRCIASPTMVKDGSGWGAFAGVSAAYLAADGFTGAPAITMDGAEHEALWADLGRRWRILELYFKPEPICRWAQPATEAVRQLRARHHIDAAMVRNVRIETFDAAVQLGSRMPQTTEEAQYAIGFPVAVALHSGRVGAAEVNALHRPEIAELCGKIELKERSDLTARFPNERIAAVSVSLYDGRTFRSQDTMARGDPEREMSDGEIAAKFEEMTSGLERSRSSKIVKAVSALTTANASATDLMDAVLGNT